MGANAYDEALDSLDGQDAAKPAATVYDQAFEAIGKQDQAQESRLRVTLQQTDPNAEQAAEDRRLALKFGVPPQQVGRDRDFWKKRERADLPYSDITRQSPATAAFAEKPENAAIVHDDMENLGFLEWVVSAPGKAFSQQLNQQTYTELRYKSMFGPLTQDEQDRMNAAKYHSELGGELGTRDSWFRKAITGTGSFLANQVPVLEYGAAGFAEGALIGGAAGSVIPGAGTAAGALAVGTYTGSAGLLYGVLKSTFQQEAGGAYDEFLGFTDELGNKIDPSVARAAALAVGAINAPIEAGAQELLLRSIPGIGKLPSAFVRSGVKQALRNPTIRASLFEMMKSYGTTLAGETGQEVAQRAFTILGGELAKVASGQNIPAKTPADVAKELVDEGIAASQSFALALLPGPALGLAVNARKAREAQKTVNFFEALGEGVANSKTGKRSPEALQAFLEQATKDGPVATVYAPTDTFATYWQDKKLDPREVAAELTGDKTAWDTAIRTGEDLAIPTARYAAKLAGTEHNAFFAQELRLQPLEMNAREASTWLEQQKAQAAERQAATEPSPRDQIRESITQQLIDNGKYEPSTAAGIARLVESGIGQMAENAGLNPADVFQSFGVEVQRPDLGTRQPAAAAAPATPATPAVEPSEGLAAATPPQIVPSAGLADVQSAEFGDVAFAEDPVAALQPGQPGAAGKASQQRDQPINVQKLGVAGAAAQMLKENPDALRDAQYLRVRLQQTRRLAASDPSTIVDKNAQQAETATHAADAGLAAGQGHADAGREQLAAHPLGSAEGGSNGPRAEPSRLPTAADYPLEPFKRAGKEADAARLTPDIRNELERIGEELREFPFVERSWSWVSSAEKGSTGNAAGGKANIAAGAAGAPVYDDVLQFAPLNTSSKKLTTARKALETAIDQKQPKKVLAFLRKQITDLEATPQLASEVSGSRAAVETAIAKMLETGVIHNNLAEGAVRVAEHRAANDYAEVGRPMLPPSWGTVAPKAFTDELSDAIDAALEDADTSFDPSEFGQGLFDLLDEGLPKPTATVDTLPTGEAQPRLPGDAGAVREQNVATPQLEAPFSLTSEVSKAKKGTQTELFQSAKPEERIEGAANAAGVSAVFIGWQEGQAPDIRSFAVYNLIGGENDGSTVSLEELDAQNIPVPPTPPKPAEYFQPAFHGTPHVFDEFSLHAIGSGEGAQAYGWGLYFASRREVAEHYRDKLAGKPEVLVGGTPIDTSKGAFDNKPALEIAASRIAYLANAHYQLGHVVDAAAIVAEVETSIANSLEFARERTDTVVLESLIAQQAALEEMKAQGITVERKGRLFKVDIPENDALLDWDSPASQQSPAVQDALRKLGVSWGTFKTKSVAQMLQWLNGPAASALFAEDIGIRESLKEGLYLAQQATYKGAKTDDALNRWQLRHQGYFNQGNVDPSGEYIYGQLRQTANLANRALNFEQTAEAASKQLADAGVPGIRYLDGSSRDRGEGSSNFVIFDPRLVQVQEFDQRKGVDPELVVQHNLTAANLLHAARMGGLAVPSLAITPAPSTITGFGEITLLGAREMADPQGYAKPQVFGADVYAPRYPTIHYKVDAAGEKRLAGILKANPEGGEAYIDLDTFEKEGAKYLEHSGAVIAAFLKERGVKVPAARIEPAKTDKSGYTRAAHVDRFGTRNALEEIVRKRNLQAELSEYAEATFESLNPVERIFKGFTNSGNKSYTPHTLENVVRILKREMRGAETAGNLYGMGQLRAKFTPRFRSVAAIKKAATRIVDEKAFEAIKEETEREFFAISDQLKGSYDAGVDPFRFTDTVLAVLEDTPTMGLNKALETYSFSNVSDVTKTAIGDFLSRLRTMPTEYFEAKIMRSVGLEEFAGAVVPEGTSDQVLQLFKDRGIAVGTYAKSDDVSRRAAVAQLAQQLGDKVLFQEKGQRRGSIVFSADRKVTINLFADADLSTFLHETGHFFLEVFGDLVDRLQAIDPEQLTPTQRKMLADYGALLQEFGVENRSQIAVEHHERFARMFETYLFEGKAPSLELRSMFSRFRAWLLGVYGSLKRLNAPLTDEVRGVLDRMLASEQAIAESAAAAHVEAMFSTAEMAGMTPAEFELYRSTVVDASARAREELDRKLVAEVQREQTAQWKARRTELATQVETEMGERPVYRAVAAMQFGTNPDGSALVDGEETPPLKLSRAIILERFGEERLRTLPRPYVYAKDGGLDPDTVATRFGFNSGDELLTAVATVEPFRRAVERETNARMIREHGSILLDGTLHEKATAALSNEDRDLVIRKELRALGQLRRTVAPHVDLAQQQAGDQARQQTRERDYERRWFEAEAKLRIAIAEGHKQVEIDALRDEVRNLRQKARGGAATIRAGIPPANTLKAAAAARIAGTRVRDLKPAVFWSASRKAAQLAIDHAARQDFDAAITAKQQELINVALYREATAALEDVEKRVRAARDLARPKTMALLGDSYADQIAGILDRFGLARMPQRMLERRTSLSRFISALEGEGVPIDLPDEVLEEHIRRNYQDLSVEELVGVTDGLQHLAHLARSRNRLLKAQKAAELDTIAASLADSIREHGKGKRREGARDRRPSEERKRTVEDWFAGHRKLASTLREMDGFQDGGAMWDAIMRPMNDAGNAEAEMNAKATEAFHALVETAFPGKEKRTLYTKRFVEGANRSMSRMERIMVAANWGNDGNRDRVRRAEGWTDEQVQTVLDTLTASDLAFVQGVFDLFESYKPLIGEKQKRITGIEPTWVDPVTITAAGGSIRGGYFPLKYDDRLSAGAIKNLDLEAANLARQAAYAHATTKRGHTKERVRTVKMKVRLDFGVMFEHVDQVIHDLTHHEALIDVGRILGHRDVAAAILEQHGDIVYKQMRGSLRDIAFGDIPAKSGFERALNHVRAGATVAGLGWNLTTAFLQPLGLANSYVRIGPKYLARGLSRWLRHPTTMMETVDWITEKSAFMRSRGRTQQREINEIRNSVNVSTGSFGGWMDEILEKTTGDLLTRQGIGDSYFWMIQQMQRVADVPTWLGAYEKAMDTGESEERAIAMADQAVLDSQGGGQIKDLAQVQRGGPMMRLWTNFYSFFNVLYNQASESRRRTNFKDPSSVGKLASDYLMLFVVPAVLGFYLREAIRPGDDKQATGWGLLGEVASYVAGTMLGLREISATLQGYYGYEGPAGARFFASLSRLGQQIRQGEADAAFRRSAIDVTGALLHLPASQINRTIDGITALDEGKTDNPLAVVAGAPRAR